MKINKRIAISFVTIAGVLAGVVGITFAALSDSATLSANTLSSGNADLRIANFTADCANESYDPGDPSLITGIQTSNVAPGGSASKDFCLKNFSNGTFSLDVTATLTNGVGNTFPDLTLVTVSVVCGGPTESGNLQAGLSGSILVNLTAGQSQKCTITQGLDSSATNTSAGKTVMYDVRFDGAQNGA